MIRIFALVLAMASPALAHGLNVFASVDGDAVVVEAKFTSGRMPSVGEVRVFDGAETLLQTIAITEAGPIRVPLADLDTSTGLVIEVESSDGHEDYWILTPDDLAPAN